MKKFTYEVTLDGHTKTTSGISRRQALTLFNDDKNWHAGKSRYVIDEAKAAAGVVVLADLFYRPGVIASSVCGTR